MAGLTLHVFINSDNELSDYEIRKRGSSFTSGKRLHVGNPFVPEDYSLIHKSYLDTEVRQALREERVSVADKIITEHGLSYMHDWQSVKEAIVSYAKLDREFENARHMDEWDEPVVYPCTMEELNLHYENMVLRVQKFVDKLPHSVISSSSEDVYGARTFMALNRILYVCVHYPKGYTKEMKPKEYIEFLAKRNK